MDLTEPFEKLEKAMKIQKRKESKKYREDLIDAFQNKEISLEELRASLFSYYKNRVKGRDRRCLVVSFKLTPLAMVFLDLEVILRREFVNRSEMVRIIIRDYMLQNGNRFVEDLVANTD